MRLLFATLLIAYASAWGLQGHRVTARVAELYLAPRAAGSLQKMLGDAVHLWNKTARYTQGAIAWADQYARLPEGKWSYPLHFVATNGVPYYTASDCSGACCVVGAVQKFSDELFLQLRKGEAPPVWSEAGNTGDDPLLKLLLMAHWMGDLHQPMHVNPRNDYGGNTWAMTWFGNETCFGKPCNLHKVVDTMWLARELLEYGEEPPFSSPVNDAREAKFIVDLVNEMGALVGQGPARPLRAVPDVWASRSAELCSVFYATHTADQTWADAIGPSIKLQLFLAGYRIAQTLNFIFDGELDACPMCAYSNAVCLPNATKTRGLK